MISIVKSRSAKYRKSADAACAAIVRVADTSKSTPAAIVTTPLAESTANAPDASFASENTTPPRAAISGAVIVSPTGAPRRALSATRSAAGFASPRAPRGSGAGGARSPPRLQAASASPSPRVAKRCLRPMLCVFLPSQREYARRRLPARPGLVPRAGGDFVAKLEQPLALPGACLAAGRSGGFARRLFDSAIGVFRKPAALARKHGCVVAIRPAAELRAPVVGERLLELGPGVHHERAVLRHRFRNRPALEHEDLDAAVGGRDRQLEIGAHLDRGGVRDHTLADPQPPTREQVQRADGPRVARRRQRP